MADTGKILDIMNAGQGLIAPAIGMGIEALSHPMQVRHQQDFIDQQMNANKSMASYMQMLGMKTWKETNYSAQMEELKKAGLNPGLLYAKGGPGGTTATPSGGNVSGGQSRPASENMGMALQMVSQAALLKAQKENIEADTELKRKEALKKDSEIPNIDAGTQNILSDTELKKQQKLLTEFNTEIARWDAELKKVGYSLNLGKLDAEYKNLVSQTNLNEKQIEEIDAKIINLGVQNALMKSNIKLNEAEVNKIATEINAINSHLKQEIKDVETRRQTLYYYGIDVLSKTIGDEKDRSAVLADIMSVIGIVGGALSLKGGKPNPAGFKYGKGMQ